MRKIAIIDDDQLFLDFLAKSIRDSYPMLDIRTFSNPVQGLSAIDDELDLLLIDLEMPKLGGTKLLAYARAKGISKNKIIILSGRDADYLHQQIPMGECLAVLNKHESRQQEVLEMLLTALQRKGADENDRS